MAKMKSMQIFLNLSYNLLDGNIPQELGMLEAVQAIDLSNNNLSGIIPKTLAGCRNLFSLDLSGNKLSGSIPAEALVQMSMLSLMNLSRNDLNGQIPEKLAELKHLSALDLSRNQLEGIIPYSFGNLSSLKHLNLSFNHLEGRVPESGLFKNISSSSLVGNPALCGTKSLKSCSKKNSHTFSKKTTVFILLAIGVVSIFLVLSVVIPLFLQRAKKHKTTSTENMEPEFTSALKLIRYDRNEIENATSFFSEENIIGASSLSTVYKGQLEDGKTIAVKQLNFQKFSAESDKCFYREIKTLSQLRHRNLVKVLGYAWESAKLKVLVLEYMQNGSLESIIHNPQVDQSWWTLYERINVCVSIASALEYLHSGYDFPIVHCDLKPSNVLLDGDWVAHVSDFGTARILGVHLQDGNSLSSASAFEGTIGYMAPGNLSFSITLSFLGRS
jgi:LRR receptor-like serine/threonine-protein kinase FLS2